jgi:hypothetical protein
VLRGETGKVGMTGNLVVVCQSVMDAGEHAIPESA